MTDSKAQFPLGPTTPDWFRPDAPHSSKPTKELIREFRLLWVREQYEGIAAPEGRDTDKLCDAIGYYRAAVYDELVTRIPETPEEAASMLRTMRKHTEGCVPNEADDLLVRNVTTGLSRMDDEWRAKPKTAA